MKPTKFNFLLMGALLCFIVGLQSCDTNSDYNYNLLQPTALVTVCPQDDESVLFQLDDTTQLNPVNIKKSPFGKKEVRALVNYSPVSGNHTSAIQDVNVNWIDSIRTKFPVKTIAGEENNFANDPVDIINDWVTIAEDGYLTLRIRTRWGCGYNMHNVDLIYDDNSLSPLVFELRHNANGDLSGSMGDALIAFNLNNLIANMEKPVKITLKWHSFSGDKSAEFSLGCRKNVFPKMQDIPRYSNMLK